MAYAQPRYGGVPSQAHAQLETSHEPQQQQDYAVHHHGNGYQNYDNYHEPTYNSGQYQSDNYHAPHGNSGRENGYYGGIAHLDGMRQGRGYGGAAVQQSQQRGGSDEKYAHQEHRARRPQSNHRPLANGHRSPPVNPHPQAGMQLGTRRPHAQENRDRQESAWKDGSMQPDGGYQRKDHYYEPCDDQSYRPQQPPIATNRSVDVTSQLPQPAVQFQQHGNSQFHGNGVVLRGAVNHRPGSAPKPASSRAQRQPTPPKPAASQPPKQKILGEINSPDTIAWDNPFPTFPTAKKKAIQTNGNNLDEAVVGMSLHNVTQGDQTQSQRPSTANSKGSKSSSFSNERTPTMRQMQDYPNQQNQSQREGHEESSATQNDYNEFRNKPQPYTYQYKDTHYSAPKHQQVVREEWPIPRNSEAPAITGRRSEDANAVSSVHPPKLASGHGSQWINTMPNNRAETIPNFEPPSNYAEPSWQEPGPNAGYYGPNDKEYLPTSPAKSKQTRARSADHPKPELDVYCPIQNNSYQTPSSARPTPHSGQASIGELFDSYYDTSHHDQGACGQNLRRQPQPEVDEDMPNFDAIPGSGTSHRRGTTIDDHLEPQIIAPAVPLMPAQYRGASPEYSRTSPYSPGSVPRSRSSPNLKQPRSPRSPYYTSFNFDMPGVVPAVPTKPLPRDHSANKPQNTVIHPNSSQQTYGQQARHYNYQRPGPSASHSPGNGASAYGAPPKTSHDRAQYGQNQPTVLQNTRPSTGQGRQPNDRGGQSSQTAAESLPVSAPSNPDTLPRHPAPVRPGLMQGSPVNQAPKPPPLREYNTGSSSLQQAGPTQPPDPALHISVEKRRNSVSVTYEELERLRQTVTRSPSDQKTQLILAKKMVEAASVLIDQRADQRTKAKMREKFILDAHKIVKKLVNNGYAEAAFYLADCYSRGHLGLETDPKEAFNLYQSAAKAGHPQAAYRVAVCCEMGQEEGGGTRRDPLKAMQWYKRAATLGDTPAMYKMGIIQLKGLLGQPKNPNQAVTWLKRAADRADEENPHALHELGLLHEKDGGNEGVIKDEVYSKQLFTQAAKLGYKFSQFRLGCAYEYGLMGCPVDPRQSIAWYSKAAVQEEHQSELALSGWYLTGSEAVLQQSDTEAYLWARKAAQAGLAKAEYAMGYFTEVGIGAPANLEDAKRWYWRAASQSFPKARDRLEDLRKGGAKMEKSRVSRSAVNKQSEGDCVVM